VGGLERRFKPLGGKKKKKKEEKKKKTYYVVSHAGDRIGNETMLRYYVQPSTGQIARPSPLADQYSPFPSPGLPQLDGQRWSRLTKLVA
jgi:hypothetical protein